MHKLLIIYHVLWFKKLDLFYKYIILKLLKILIYIYIFNGKTFRDILRIETHTIKQNCHKKYKTSPIDVHLYFYTQFLILYLLILVIR